MGVVGCTSHIGNKRSHLLMVFDPHPLCCAESMALQAKGVISRVPLEPFNDSAHVRSYDIKF